MCKKRKRSYISAKISAELKTKIMKFQKNGLNTDKQKLFVTPYIPL